MIRVRGIGQQTLWMTIASVAVGTMSARAATLDCLTPNNDGNGYNQSQWTTVTADLNSANAGPLATCADLSNLNQMLNYTGLWVDVRQPDTGSLTALESANLQAYIATGRRVVLIGGPGSQDGESNYQSWDDSLATAINAPTGASFFYSDATPAYASNALTTGISSIAVPAGAVVSSGTSLFHDRVVTVWGPARNVVLMLDVATFNDDIIPLTSDSPFAKNMAQWVTGNLSDGPAYWHSTAGGAWNSSASWINTLMPNVADDAVFNLSAGSIYTVTVPAAFTARNLLVPNDHVDLDATGSSSSLLLSQSITVGTTAGTASSLMLTHSSAGGTAVITAAGATVNSGSTLAVGSNTQLTVNGPVTGAGAINVAAGAVLSAVSISGPVITDAGVIRITGTGANQLPAPALTTSDRSWTGQLDLGKSDLILSGGSLSIITSQLRSGFNNGAWNGSGIASSFSAADPAHLHALGVILNDDGTGHPIYGSGAPLGLFDGISPVLDTLLIRTTVYGDANLDGTVDGSDYTLIDNGYNNRLTGWSNGDFNYDGVIDGSDYTLIDNTFNVQGSPSGAVLAQTAASTAQRPGAAPVPEPAPLMLVALTSLTMFNRSTFRFRLKAQ